MHNDLEQKDLSKLEQELMEIVWERGEVSAQEARESLGPSRELAKNTVRTLLDRMEKKGWLKHREEGRTYIYSAIQPRETSNARRVVEIVEQLFGNSPEQLMAALLDHRGLSAAELSRIRTMLDQAKAKRISSKGK